MPETQTQKRKRSLQDTPIDKRKMTRVTNSLNALREELSGIDETEEKMEGVMKHVDELDCILKETKRIVHLSFIWLWFFLNIF